MPKKIREINQEQCRYCQGPKPQGFDITDWEPWSIYYCSPECEKSYIKEKHLRMATRSK